jgi:arginyl-tRNA synthetase
MPLKFGVGFTAKRQILNECVEGYRFEQADEHHCNYHVTPENWRWGDPPQFDWTTKYVIDGFSPNLNKSLHVGHIRQLALAKSLSRILADFNPKMVAILGCSLGVIKSAITGWEEWTALARYSPKVYHDVVLPQDVICTREPTPDEINNKVIDSNLPDDLGGDFELPALWDGPNGPVIVKRSDGRPLYAFYDIVFAKEVGPTHYITGIEQKEHFTSLGLGDKHLPMGLVLGSDGKKLKSRTQDAMSAIEALGQITELIAQHAHTQNRTITHVKEIAWNILAWNMLHASRPTNLKFEVEKWVRTESPGMYITYTYARVLSALNYNRLESRADLNAVLASDGNLYQEGLTEEDAKLLGLAEQYVYYHYKAVEQLDPAPLANFAHDLARAISVAYESETIRDGRPAFVKTMAHMLGRLECCMDDLGMYCIDSV